MIPREFDCRGISYDASNPSNPFGSNPIQTVTMLRLTSFKNKRNGAIAGLLGDVRYTDFKTADNILAGMEVERISATIKDGYMESPM
jgi:hypothetical protein